MIIRLFRPGVGLGSALTGTHDSCHSVCRAWFSRNEVISLKRVQTSPAMTIESHHMSCGDRKIHGEIIELLGGAAGFVLVGFGIAQFTHT
jgi:hypothetical protein